jgi:thiosulfate/3-mercaptopyruvate sulfurtransferase
MSLPKWNLILICGICAAFLAVIVLSSENAHAGPECASLGASCDDGSGWDGSKKLDEIGDPNAGKVQTTDTKWPEKSRTTRWTQPAYGFGDENGTSTDNTTADGKVATKATKNATTATAKAAVAKTTVERSENDKLMLLPIAEVSESDVLLDVSENSTTHIPGSVVIPYMQFDEEAGILKETSEICKILGDNGISNDDSVVIYGECLPCGGGPFLSAYVYSMLKGLGHEKVKILDGTAEDWAASGRATSDEAKIRSGTVYTPKKGTQFNATYEYVSSGKAQIVDARTLKEYASGTIPGSISIPYTSVLDGKKLKDDASLDRVFAILNKDKPVVVFTSTGMKASVLWFALEMRGYDAKTYTYRDWTEHQS